MKHAIRLMRPQQWVKNLLVFAGVFFSGEFTRSGTLQQVALVFLVFCILSSATYIFNDWRDVDFDRQLPSKRYRPLALGLIDKRQALFLMAGCYAVVFTIGVFAGFSTELWLVFVLYVGINISYSLGLKHVAIVELFCVVSGFLLRFFAGVVDLRIPVSPWIISTIAIGSLLMVCAKRRADLLSAPNAGTARRSLQGYNLEFLNSVVTSLGAGVLIVYLLFCVSDYAESRYGPKVMITTLPVAMGLLRFQQKVFVEGADQPTEALFQDWFLLGSLVCFMLMFAVFLYL